MEKTEVAQLLDEALRRQGQEAPLAELSGSALYIWFLVGALWLYAAVSLHCRNLVWELFGCTGFRVSVLFCFSCVASRNMEAHLTIGGPGVEGVVPRSVGFEIPLPQSCP